MKKQTKQTKLVLLVLALVIIPVTIVLVIFFLGETNKPIDEDSKGEETPDTFTVQTVTTIANEGYEEQIELGFSDVKESFQETSSSLMKKSPQEVVKKFQELLGQDTWTSTSTTFQCNPEFDKGEYLSSQVFTTYKCSNSESYEVPMGSSCTVVWNENYRFVDSLSVELVTDSWEENSRTLRDLIVFATEEETLGDWVANGRITPSNVLQEALNEVIETENGYWQVTLFKSNNEENRSESKFTMEFVPTIEWIMSQEYWVSYAGVNVESQENFAERNREVFEEASPVPFEEALDKIVDNYHQLVATLREDGENFSMNASSTIETCSFDEAPDIVFKFSLPIEDSFLDVKYSYEDSKGVVSVSVESYGKSKADLQTWLNSLTIIEIEAENDNCYVLGQF